MSSTSVDPREEISRGASADPSEEISRPCPEDNSESSTIDLTSPPATHRRASTSSASPARNSLCKFTNQGTRKSLAPSGFKKSNSGTPGSLQALTCLTCGTSFKTRSQLHSHVSRGYAAIVESASSVARRFPLIHRLGSTKGGPIPNNTPSWPRKLRTKQNRMDFKASQVKVSTQIVKTLRAACKILESKCSADEEAIWLGYLKKNIKCFTKLIKRHMNSTGKGQIIYHQEPFQDAPSVECKHCKKELKSGGGTSNMLAHLRRTHPWALTEELNNNDESTLVSNVNVNNGNMFPSTSLRNSKLNRLQTKLAGSIKGFSK
ncbi:unnamed protein product [Brassicogethes aeneus]|uniref:BED-type domain-containing protein n=1 Tax=Brassicogethes aeneus TaxID=1431903 RepID=A0A9P0BGR3_BRAAE|nr:unnamed protein product [Brassicogethes aeneus]